MFFDMMGAVARVLDRRGQWTPQSYSAVLAHVQRSLGARTTTTSPQKWNDAPDRNFAKVATMLMLISQDVELVG